MAWRSLLIAMHAMVGARGIVDRPYVPHGDANRRRHATQRVVDPSAIKRCCHKPENKKGRSGSDRP
jgi:hypothetical protein